jgi:hypothetical protein
MMKRFLLVIAFLAAVAGVKATDISALQSALKGGNASSLTSSMGEQVEVAIPGTNKKCSGTDAVNALASFFGGNKPTDFKVLHQADKADGGFVVGKLPTAKGEFRVNITYTNKNNKPVIQSIRIEQ